MSIPFVADTTTPGPGIYTPEPGLVRVVAPNAGPFTYTGTGTYLVHDTQSCVVIDPGPDDASHVDTLCEAVGSMRLDAILITHTHRDHSPASRLLQQRCNAPIFGCAPAGQVKITTHHVAMDESQDTDYAPDRVLEDGESLHLAGQTFRVFATPGHLANHLCYLWEDRKALFSGDHIMGWATSVVIPPDGHMGSYMESLARTAALDVETLWPTHGQPVREPKPFIAALIAHRQAREKAVLEQINAGNGHIGDIVEALYQDTPKALHPAAAQSVFAHIIHLAEKRFIKTPKHMLLSTFFEPIVDEIAPNK